MILSGVVFAGAGMDAPDHDDAEDGALGGARAVIVVKLTAAGGHRRAPFAMRTLHRHRQIRRLSCQARRHPVV
jgi:hypothetical protein